MNSFDERAERLFNDLENLGSNINAGTTVADARRRDENLRQTSRDVLLNRAHNVLESLERVERIMNLSYNPAFVVTIDARMERIENFLSENARVAEALGSIPGLVAPQQSAESAADHEAAVAAVPLIDCGICQLPVTDPIQLGVCKHVLCASCISEWMKRQSTCPLCRAPINSMVYNEVIHEAMVAHLARAPHDCAFCNEKHSYPQLVACKANDNRRRMTQCEKCSLRIANEDAEKHAAKCGIVVDKNEPLWICGECRVAVRLSDMPHHRGLCEKAARNSRRLLEVEHQLESYRRWRETKRCFHCHAVVTESLSWQHKCLVPCMFCRKMVETYMGNYTRHLSHDCEAVRLECPYCKTNVVGRIYDMHISICERNPRALDGRGRMTREITLNGVETAVRRSRRLAPKPSITK